MDRIDHLLKQWEKERPDLDATPVGILGRLMILNKLAERGVESKAVAQKFKAEAKGADLL